MTRETPERVRYNLGLDCHLETLKLPSAFGPYVYDTTALIIILTIIMIMIMIMTMIMIMIMIMIIMIVKYYLLF